MYNRNLLFRTAESSEQYYVVKQRKGEKLLTAEDVIRDHIANSIYRLFGVQTPDIYIGLYQGRLSLISKVLPNYKDLVEWLDAEDPIQEINQHNDVVACVTAYQQLEKELFIQNKEALLAAAIILEDSDVIGAGMRNIGLVENNGKHTIIKIDPDDSIFGYSYSNLNKALDEFEANLSWNNSFVLTLFSVEKVSNNPKSILGNLHLYEFFHGMDKDKLISAFEKFINIDDTDLKNLIIRKEYIDLLDSPGAQNYLEWLSSIIIGKKAILKKFINSPAKEVGAPIPAPVFNPNIELSEPLEVIPYGASKPVKVKLIQPENKENLNEHIDFKPATMF